MQFTRPEGLEHPIPRSQAKDEKSDFLRGFEEGFRIRS